MNHLLAFHTKPLKANVEFLIRQYSRFVFLNFMSNLTSLCEILLVLLSVTLLGLLQ